MATQGCLVITVAADSVSFNKLLSSKKLNCSLHSVAADPCIPVTDSMCCSIKSPVYSLLGWFIPQAAVDPSAACCAAGQRAN
jgi:hypothetical protein